MKKRRLKRYVIPTLYITTVSVIIITVVYLSSLTSIVPNTDDQDYVIDSLITDNVPVVSEVSTKAVKPYIDENVKLSKDYYSMNDENVTQEGSLIYYQNTYMQNTGILYTYENVFDVVSVLDGTIKNIVTDDILGIVVEVSHSNNLISYYYSLSEVTVKVGDTVKAGDIIAKSGDNKIENKEGTSLLFEIYHQGKTIDPNEFFENELKNYE